MPDSIFKHSFKATLRENMGLSVYNCGYQKCEPLYSWGPAVRDHYLIHYIASGSGRLHCGGHEYSLKEGDGFITAPLQMIYYQADAIEPWEYYWVGFNGADATRLINTAGLTDRQVFQIEKKDVILNALKKIYDSGGTRAVDDMRMTGYLYLFFSKLIGNLDEGNVGSANGYDYIQTALRYIEYNYSMDISVNDISKSVGISRSHLYRLFVKYIGSPPNEYLTKFRISKASLLLRDKHLSVSEAAYSSGFSDVLYFSRVFKRIKGVPPSTYYKMEKNKSGSPDDFESEARGEFEESDDE